MKSYSKGMFVGISLVLVSLLFMGNTNYNTVKQNKFEIHMHKENVLGKNVVIDRVLLLNTETGEMWRIENTSHAILTKNDGKYKIVDKE